MPTPRAQYNPQTGNQGRQEVLDEMTVQSQQQNTQRLGGQGMGPNVSAMSQQLNVGGPMPEVMSNMASLEAAMLMGNSRNPPGNIWTQPIVQKNMQKEALGLEEEAQNAQRAEAEKQANKQRFDAIVQQKKAQKDATAKRKEDVLLMIEAFGADPDDPEVVQKVAGLAKLKEAGFPPEVIEAATVQAGFVPREDEDAAANIKSDRNGVPRYMGGAKHGQEVFPDVEVTPDMSQQLATEKGFRTALDAQLKDFYTVDDSYARVQTSGKVDTPAANMALIFGYMNLLDPGVSVRKDDYENVSSTIGMPERVKNMWRQVGEGKTLGINQKKELVEMSEALRTAAYNQGAKSVSAYSEIARNAGVNVDNVIAGFAARDKPKPRAANPNQLKEFKNESELNQAVANGVIKEGDQVIVGGMEGTYTEGN